MGCRDVVGCRFGRLQRAYTRDDTRMERCCQGLLIATWCADSQPVFCADWPGGCDGCWRLRPCAEVELSVRSRHPAWARGRRARRLREPAFQRRSSIRMARVTRRASGAMQPSTPYPRLAAIRVAWPMMATWRRAALEPASVSGGTLNTGASRSEAGHDDAAALFQGRGCPWTGSADRTMPRSGPVVAEAAELALDAAAKYRCRVGHALVLDHAAHSRQLGSHAVA